MIYFKFHLSIVHTSFVILKLYVNYGINIFVICLTKRDVKWYDYFGASVIVGLLGITAGWFAGVSFYFTLTTFGFINTGGDSKVDTPVPIPNTEVKHFYADGSKLNLARVGSCQSLFN